MTISCLLDQAVAIAREVAIGNTGISAVVVALTDGGPAVLFVETDDDPASHETMSHEVDAFLAYVGASRWLAISEVEMQLSGRLPESGLIRCVAHDRGMETSVLLRPARDQFGLIRCLEEVRSVLPQARDVAGRICS